MAFTAIDLSTTRFVTSSLVLLECADHAARKPCRMEVIRMRDELGISGDLFEPLPGEIADAWALYTRKESGAAAVIDLTSFAIMRRLGIHEAFTNDHHFTDAGFVALF